MDAVTDAIREYFNLDQDELTGKQRTELNKFLQTNESNVSLLLHPDDSSSNSMRLKSYTDQQKLRTDLSKVKQLNEQQSRSDEKLIVFVKVRQTSDERPAVVNEDEVVNRLTLTLRNDSVILNILNELHKFGQLENVQVRIRPEREALVGRIIDWANNCVAIDEQENENAKRIAKLTINKSKIRTTLQLAGEVLRDLDEFDSLRQELEQIERELTDECDVTFRQWCDQCSSIEFNQNKQCIEFDEQTQIPFVTYDQRLIEFMNDCRLLSSLNYQLPEDLVQMNRNALNYAEVARELSNIISFYCTIGDQILISQRPMLIEPAKRFTSLLESKNMISWSQNEIQLKKWLEQLRRFCGQFENENRNLRRYHQNVLNQLMRLFELNVDQWPPLLSNINLMLLEVDQKYSNSYGWRKHWCVQLYKVLNLNFKRSVLNCDAWLGGLDAEERTLFQASDAKFKIDLIFTNKRVQFRPSFEQIREKLYRRINKFLSIPLEYRKNSKGLQSGKRKDPFLEQLFANVLVENQPIIGRLYQHAELILSELNTIAGRFVEWTGLYSIVQANSKELIDDTGTNEENQMLNEYLSSLETFKTNLLLLKNRSQKFNKEFTDNELNCARSNILINLSPIKVFVDWVHLELDKILVRMLSKRLEKEAELIGADLGALIAKFQQPPNSIEQLKEFELLVKGNELTSRMHRLADRYDEFENKQSFVQKWSADNAISAGDLQSILSKLQNYIKNKEQHLARFKQEMQSTLKQRCGQLVNSVKEFNLAWKQNETDRSSKATEKLDERYQQLELENEQLVQICEYFGEPVPGDLKDQQAVLADYSQVSGKMKILGSLDVLLQPYFELEWIAARNKLSQMAAVIQSWCEENLAGKPPNSGGQSPAAQSRPSAKQDSQEKFVTKRIEEIKSLLQILKLCKGEYFVKTHWDELLQILELDKSRRDGKQLDHENLKLVDLMMKRELLIGRKDEIRKLNERALSELSIRDALVELDSFSEQTKFDTNDYRLISGEQVKLIKNWHNVIGKLSECIMTIHSLKSVDQLNNNELAEKVAQWEQRLFSLDTAINLLNKVQRKWTYLEPIYTKNTIEMLDQNTFGYLSSQFLAIMSQIVADSHVIRLVRIAGLDAKLTELNANLSSAQKKLYEFMEQSRDRFPRFYFLSDDDLLLILAGKVDLNTSGLLRKLFNNCVSQLSIDEERQICAIHSVEGEQIRLDKRVKIIDNQGAKGIEQWLTNLSAEISSTLQNQLNGILKSSTSLTDLIQSNKYCNQIVLLKRWLDFTREVENAITAGKLNELKTEFERSLSLLTSLDSTVRLESVQQIQIKSLVLDAIHFVAVVDELIENEVNQNVQSWHWQRQFRYYHSAGSVRVCMGCSELNYSYEYLGCFNKLVHTPLTDKCFLTCMQALKLGLGGNPFGMAGTGKTESIKALGQHLGRQVLVFNCDEGIDVPSITRILIGLVKCGYWGCFDEFNRLQLNVLSALSTHIATIQNALKHRTAFELQTSDTKSYQIECNHNASLFVTLNPAGLQYKARNRLPENLKALFLPISMQSPQIQLIATVILLAEGFELELSREIGRKIHVFFTLARQSFSKQVHYDWGLRAIKSCLNSAGRNLKAQTGAQTRSEQQTDDAPTTDRRKRNLNQLEIFISSMNAQLKPKLVLEDEQLYSQLLTDVFGYGREMKESKNSEQNREFRRYVEQAFTSLKLIKNDEQLIKVIELNEQVESRLGIALIGDSGVGKTTVWRLLIESLRLEQQDRKSKESGHTVKSFDCVIINPKAIDRDQLLGYIDADSNEWFDGLFSMKSREIVLSQNVNAKHFIVFDGEIDPQWIEALNSVLDDNQVLTLPTGERIDFNPSRICLLFETTSLAFASPATISRLGIICVSKVKSELFLAKRLQDCKLDRATVSVDELVRSLTQVPLDLKMSKSRTLMATIKYAQSNQIDLKRLGQLRFELADGLVQSARPLDTDFCVTKCRSRSVSYCQMLMKENGHFVLFGPAGSGKQKLLRHIGQLGNEFCLNIDCVPTLNTSQVLRKLKKHCTLVSQGANKILKSPTGGKLIILVRHLELLDEDEWQCKQLIAFLTGLLAYDGCFDAGTGEWIEFHNYQLICTCLADGHELSASLSKRFLNLLHMVSLDYPNLEELSYILSSMLKKVDQKQMDQIDWDKMFVNNYVQILDGLINGLRNNKYEPQLDLAGLDALRNGQRIIDRLRKYDHLNERSFVREIHDALHNQLATDRQIRVLSQVIKQRFSGDDLEQYYLACDRFDGRLLEQDYAEFEYKWRSVIDNWCNENEYLQRKLCLTKEFLGVLSTINCFLCDKNDLRIQALFLLGSHGTGRKLFTSIVCNHLAYDRLWTVEEPLTDKQLSNELRALFGELADGGNAKISLPNPSKSAGKSNESKDPDEIRKVLIVLDEMHFQMMPYLQKTVYLLACEYNEFLRGGTSLSVKIVVLNSSLNARDRHLWNSISLFKRVPILPDQSLLSLTVQLIDEQIAFDEQKKFLVHTNAKSNGDRQTNSEDDGYDDEFDDNDLAEELAAMLIKIKNVFRPAIDENLRIYYHLIETFRLIFNHEQTHLLNKRERLALGIQRLEQSGHQVQVLKDQAAEQQKQLAKKRQEAEQALNMITSSMNSSEAHQVEIEEVRSRTQKETEHIEQRRSVINEQLSKIEPQLKAANQAVSSIRVEQLNEIRSLRAPPETIRDILEAVLRLLGNLDTSWNAMKSFLGRRGVKEELLNFNCRKVSKENLVKVQDLIKSKPSSFTEAAARRASIAAYPLANWAKSVVAYSTVLQEIEPLETELNRLQSSLQMAEMRISSLNSELRTVGDVVSELKQKLNQTTLEAAEIEVNYKKTKQTLETSEQLVGQLSDEYSRWSDQLKEIDRLNQQLIVNSLLASVYLSFCMSQNSSEEKERIVKRCCEAMEISTRAKLDQIFKFLNCGDEQEVIAKFGGSYLTQLVVDPGNLLVEHLNSGEHEKDEQTQQQSTKKTERLKSTSMSRLQSARKMSRSVSSLHSNFTSSLSGKRYELLDILRPDFAKLLELCVRFGKIAVLNDYDGFEFGKSSLANDVFIYSLFKRDLYGAEGARQWIRLGNKKVDLNPNFRLYITKSFMPSLDRCSASYFTLINFMPNSANTEIKFLSLIIRVRKPELEKRKQALEQEQKSMQRRLQELEDELLIKLNDSTGSLLEDQNLVDSLKQTKQLANEISASLARLAQLSEQLEKERNQFKPLAQFASNVYFRLQQLKSLSPVYRLGINEFEQLFTYTLRGDPNLSTGRLLNVMFNHYINTLLPIDQKVFGRFFAEDQDEDYASGTDDLQNEGTMSLIDYVENNLKCLEHRPILILTSPGVNPLKELEQAADRLNIKSKQFISLSSDLLPDTERKLATFYQQSEHSVLCISNLHLFINWLPKLARLCLEHVTTTQTANDYAQTSGKKISLVVLISETEAEMPINLVELCSKFTYQPPTGLQAQLSGLLEQSNRNDAELVQFAYLHVICSERRNYVPVGWLKHYEFGLNEYQAGLNLIRLVRSQFGKESGQRARLNQLNQKEFINGFIHSIVYGAKLDTDFDLRILKSLVNSWLNSDTSPAAEYVGKTQLNAETEIKLLGLAPNITKWQASIQSHLIKQKLLLLTSQLNENDHQEFDRLVKLVQDLQLSRYLNALAGQRADEPSNSIQVAISIQARQAQRLGELILRCLNQPHKQDLLKLSKNETPDHWLTCWSLGSTEADLFIRKFHRLISNFITADQLSSLKFRLDQVLNPSALFNAIKQQAARTLSVTMDKIEMRPNWNSNSLNGLKMFKITVSGLSLVGAQMSGTSALRKCQSDSEFKQKIDEIQIDYFAKDTKPKEEQHDLARIPLFGSEERDELIEYIDIPCEKSTKEYWTLASVALIIDL